MSTELETFCRNWRAKAGTYCIEETAGAFDKFFTLYVVFNRLYAEATFRLARRKKITLKDRFPDSKAAQDYVLQFCKAAVLTSSWEENAATRAALDQIAEHLRQRTFALRLDMVTGERSPQADSHLLAALESRSCNRRAKAGLEALYAIRCNMFHGHKGFEPVQLALLTPAILLLESTVDVLYRALERDV